MHLLCITYVYLKLKDVSAYNHFLKNLYYLKRKQPT